jgi:uncharacterized membrane protein YuzA (DUF378 family)
VKRWAILLIAVAAIGAIVALAFGDSTVATALAIVLIGCAAVGAVSLAFYAIGEAEDRDRAEAEAEAQRSKEANGQPPEDPHPRSLGLGPERRAQRPPRRPQ